MINIIPTTPVGWLLSLQLTVLSRSVITTPVGWLLSLQADRPKSVRNNQTGWMTVVAPADRPKSVRNSCVIERICSVFVTFHLCIVCRSGVFVIRPRQISSLFSYIYSIPNKPSISGPYQHLMVIWLLWTTSNSNILPSEQATSFCALPVPISSLIYILTFWIILLLLSQNLEQFLELTIFENEI